MRGAASTMTLLRPANATEALKLYAGTPDALPIAGGTDLMVTWNTGDLNHHTVLDLSRVRSWRRVTEKDESWVLGALVTHRQVQSDENLSYYFPLLAQACATVGGAQIQNRGTVAGNIANASPAGDTFPPLAVYEALVHTARVGKRRVIPFRDVFAGVKKTTLEEGELITAVELPHPWRKPQRAMFRKVGTRSSQAISKTVAAAQLWMKRDGTVRELRFALGSMAPTVRRLHAAEEHVQGRKLTRKVIDRAVELLDVDVSPIDDLRSSREYRLTVSRNLLRAFLEG